MLLEQERQLIVEYGKTAYYQRPYPGHMRKSEYLQP